MMTFAPYPPEWANYAPKEDMAFLDGKLYRRVYLGGQIVRYYDPTRMVPVPDTCMAKAIQVVPLTEVR